MNFQRGESKESLELNLIPLIDVLLVILIFLLVTTTYSKYAQLQINLPEVSDQIQAQKPEEKAKTVNIAIDSSGHYVINDTPINFTSVESFSEALKQAAGGAKEPVVAIHADGAATHQSVINVMQAAQIAGFTSVTFETQQKPAT